MNFKLYENTIPYPVKSHFKKIQTRTFTTGETDSISVLDIESYQQAKQDYQQREQEILNPFKLDLFEELGILDNPKKELLFEKAWSYGHDEGLERVFEYAEELVDLIY